MRAALGMCLVGIALLAARPARAYEEKATAEFGVGYAAVPGNSALPQNGVQFAALGSWGFAGPWTLRGQLSYSLHPNAQPLHVGIATAEIVYALDIVRFVPFLGLGIDGLLTARAGQTGGDFGLHIVGGVDFLARPNWLVGLDVRAIWLPTSISSNFEPWYLTVTARFGYVFDLGK